MPGTLYVVATPIGNLEDITARALRVLREATLIAAEDTRRTAHLLSRYAITTQTTSIHEHNERRKSAALVARLVRGEDIALVSDAGTPLVSDPGQHLVRAALEAGIKVQSVPGPSAVMAALAASGLPSETFVFLGFPPTKVKDRNDWFEGVRTAGRTVIFFEAPHRIRETLEQLLRVVGDVNVHVCREMTKAHEELIHAPLSMALGQLKDPRGEFTVVVEIGLTTENGKAREPTDAEVWLEFCHITESEGIPRRRAINAVARKWGIAPNTVYGAIERVKNSPK